MKHMDLLLERNPSLIACKDDIIRAYDMLETSYSNNRKLLVCGNGGSASDSEHIVGELMKEFKGNAKPKVNVYRFYFKDFINMEESFFSESESSNDKKEQALF